MPSALGVTGSAPVTDIGVPVVTTKSLRNARTVTRRVCSQRSEVSTGSSPPGRPSPPSAERTQRRPSKRSSVSAFRYAGLRVSTFSSVLPSRGQFIGPYEWFQSKATSASPPNQFQDR